MSTTGQGSDPDAFLEHGRHAAIDLVARMLGFVFEDCGTPEHPLRTKIEEGGFITATQEVNGIVVITSFGVTWPEVPSDLPALVEILRRARDQHLRKVLEAGRAPNPDASHG